MPATQILIDKQLYKDGSFVQFRIWQLTEPVLPSAHLYKYSVVYIVGGIRVIGFDNERGKGDHFHFHGSEYPYRFTGIALTIASFSRTCRQGALIMQRVEFRVGVGQDAHPRRDTTG